MAREYKGHYPFTSAHDPRIDTAASRLVTPVSAAARGVWKLRRAFVRAISVSNITPSDRRIAATDYLSALVAARRHLCNGKTSREAVSGAGTTFLEQGTGMWHTAATDAIGHTVSARVLSLEVFLTVQRVAGVHCEVGSQHARASRFEEAAAAFDVAGALVSLGISLLQTDGAVDDWAESTDGIGSAKDARTRADLLSAMAAQLRILGACAAGPLDAAATRRVLGRVQAVYNMYDAAAHSTTCVQMGAYAHLLADYWMVRLCLGLNEAEPIDDYGAEGVTQRAALYSARCAVGLTHAKSLTARLDTGARGRRDPGVRITTTEFVEDAAARIQRLTQIHRIHEAEWARRSIITETPYERLRDFQLDIVAPSVDTVSPDDAVAHARSTMVTYVTSLTTGATQWLLTLGGDAAFDTLPSQTVLLPPIPDAPLVPLDLAVDVLEMKGMAQSLSTMTAREKLLTLSARLVERRAWLRYIATVPDSSTACAQLGDAGSYDLERVEAVLAQWQAAWATVASAAEQ